MDSVLKVTDYSGPPALEGTTVNFHCSSGLVLIGNTSATCNAQGQWEPDPNELTCIDGKAVYCNIIVMTHDVSAVFN